MPVLAPPITPDPGDKNARTFVLRRDVDVTGISGTGDVAEGVQFSDGTTVVRWRGEHASTVIWPSIDDVLEINCHGGKTRIVWGE